MIDGIWTTNEATIKREAVNYSNKLFQNRNPCDPYSLLLNKEIKIYAIFYQQKSKEKDCKCF